MRRTLICLVLWAITAGSPVWAQTGPSPVDPATKRKQAFREFAERFVGEWACEIKEFDGKAAQPVWSDTQKRVFAFTMTRHVLEERAFLKTPKGDLYEGGLHLMTFDPKADRITQHGFWLPTQADRLFFIEGYMNGRDFDGQMTIRLDTGGEDKRPFRIRWRGDDRWTIEVDGRRPDGTSYLREVLVYTRTPAS